jgi:SAM-dependent methyltransferase
MLDAPPGRLEPDLTKREDSSARARWSANLDDEATFWRSWFVDGEFADDRVLRRKMASDGLFPEGFAEVLGLAHGELLRVLDVGSGPISTLPTGAPNNPVELVCADALADVYNELLDEFGYDEVLRPVPIIGEELVSSFGERRFDYVHIANALDHCADPARTLSEMYRVCKTGGLIAVISVENEGERQRYQGLHQWNLEADDRSLWLWTPGSRHDLRAELGAHEFSWRYVDEPGVPVFVADIKRR